MGSFRIIDVCVWVVESVKIGVWNEMIVYVDETGGIGTWMVVVWGWEFVSSGEICGTGGDLVWERFTTSSLMIFWKKKHSQFEHVSEFKCS